MCFQALFLRSFVRISAGIALLAFFDHGFFQGDWPFERVAWARGVDSGDALLRRVLMALSVIAMRDA